MNAVMVVLVVLRMVVGCSGGDRVHGGGIEWDCKGGLWLWNISISFFTAVSFCDIFLDARQQEGRGLISSTVVTPPWDKQAEACREVYLGGIRSQDGDFLGLYITGVFTSTVPDFETYVL